MSMFHYEFLPEIGVNNVSRPKGNGSQQGRSSGHNRKFNTEGVYYMDGMGCHKYDNCFTCPYPDCIFHGASRTGDRDFLQCRGDGIRP